METRGWLFKISRGFCHLKIPDAAINAVGHLNIQVRRNTYQVLAEFCLYVEFNYLWGTVCVQSLSSCLKVSPDLPGSTLSH